LLLDALAAQQEAASLAAQPVQLPREAGLADAGFATEQREAPVAGLHAIEHLHELGQFCFSRHKRRALRLLNARRRP